MIKGTSTDLALHPSRFFPRERAYPQSCADAHDSSFCGRSLGGRVCGRGRISCLRARPKGFAIALWKPSPDHPCNYAVTTTKQQETTLQLTAAYWKGAVKSTCTKPNRGLILSQPSADSSLCGGSLLAGSRVKPPLKGEVPAKRAEGFVPRDAKVAAALSAAVTTTPKQKNAPT